MRRRESTLSLSLSVSVSGCRWVVDCAVDVAVFMFEWHRPRLIDGRPVAGEDEDEDEDDEDEEEEKEAKRRKTRNETEECQRCAAHTCHLIVRTAAPVAFSFFLSFFHY